MFYILKINIVYPTMPIIRSRNIVLYNKYYKLNFTNYSGLYYITKLHFPYNTCPKLIAPKFTII